MLIRTHHQALDVFDPRLLDALPHEQNTDARPYQEKHTKRDGNQPVEGRQTERSTEYYVQGWRIDDEHAEACTSEDAREVVVVADDGPAEGEAEFRLDREYL